MDELEARLRRLERRDWLLWLTAIVVMLLLTLGIFALSLPALGSEGQPFFQSRLRQAVLGLLAVVLIFSAYAVYQVKLIKRLRGQLAEQIAAGFRMQSEMEEYQRLAIRDLLTGLYNRQFLEQYLASEVARSQRHHYPLNVLTLDLKNFKQINDHYGRATGDLVLKEFTDRLNKSIRTSDVPVRMGADEFLVLLPESSIERVPHLLARLSEMQADAGGTKIPITFAAGWTTYQPGEKPEQLLKRVEQELAHDQRTGGSEEAIHQAQAEIRQTQNIEALERLAGKVAHDFTNLLGLVRGYSEMALDRLGHSDPLREYIEEIYRANERANSLTRQLLAFTRKRPRAPEALDLNARIAGMDRMLRRMLGERIELEIRPGQRLGKVRGDWGQIEQVVLNLAANARDSMPQGGKFTLETANSELDEAYAHRHPGARPGSYVMLAARDSGAGMDAETLAHIFDPFFLHKQGDKGTGLGLAAVYGIVKQCGGYVWVDSAPGQGSTFTIYLPQVEETGLAD